MAQQLEMLNQAFETINGLEAKRAAERMEEANKLAAARQEAAAATAAAQELR